MTYSQQLGKVRAEIYFELNDIEACWIAFPQTVFDLLGDTGKDLRRVKHGGFTIVGEHINGCADQDGYERYYVIIEDLAQGIPYWLQKIKHKICIKTCSPLTLPSLEIVVSRSSDSNTADIAITSDDWTLALEAYKALARVR